MAIAESKGLILAVQRAGDGVGPLLALCGGQLIPVANKPLLHYALEAMHRAGLRDVAIVITSAVEEQARAAASDPGLSDLRITYLSHQSPPDLGAALISAERFLDGHICVVHLAHGMVRQPLRPLVDEFTRDGLEALLVLQDRAGVSSLQERRLVSLLEPTNASTNVASAGVQVLGPRVLRELRNSARTGKPSIIDSLAGLVSSGGRARGRMIDGFWRRIRDLDELLSATRIALDELEPDYDHADLRETVVQGRVVIDRSAQIDSTTVRGPAIIGAGACVRDAYIGPYTTIGEGVVIEGAEIEHSVILADAFIRDVGGRLETSLVGRGAKLFRDFALPRAMRLRVGEGAEISLT